MAIDRKNGVAMMTKSILGNDRANMEIGSAIFYLKYWPRLKGLPFVADVESVPYDAPTDTSVDETWKQWIGKWHNDWEIVDEHGPAVMYGSFPQMRLIPGAAPTKDFSEGRQEFIFVVDGFKIAPRLTWEENVRVVQLLQGEVKTLKRKGSGHVSVAA